MRRVWPLPLLVLLAACGGSPSPALLATLPAGSLPALQSRERTLAVATLAAEARDHARLKQLLEEDDYTAGAEREFFGRAHPFNHVVARTLRFGDAHGAGRYLAWVGGHLRDTLGAVRSARALALGDGGDVVRAKGCGCHGETPTYLAAWRHGNRVLWLLASGPGATQHRVAALARELDRAARGTQ